MFLACNSVAFVSVVLTTLPLLAQDTSASVKRLLDDYRTWGSGATAKPSNATLRIRESSRTDDGNIKFRLTAKNLPSNTTYSIMAWPINIASPVAVLKGATFNADGLVICAGTQNTCKGATPDEPIDLVFQPIPGEPIRLALVSSDGKSMVAAKIEPIPLRGQTGKCRANAVLLAPNAEAVIIEGSGFGANSEIAFESSSAGEAVNAKVKADGDGRYSTVLLPAVKGKDNGTLTVRMKTAACSPEVEIPWGKR